MAIVPEHLTQQQEWANDLAESLNDILEGEDASLSSSDILDELATLGLRLTKDPEGHASAAYLALCAEG